MDVAKVKAALPTLLKHWLKKPLERLNKKGPLYETAGHDLIA